MENERIKVEIEIPKSWRDLDDRQLMYVYSLIAQQYDSIAVKSLCLLKWSGLKVVVRVKENMFVMKKGKHLFLLSSEEFTSLISAVDWLGGLPDYPVRPSIMKRMKAITADFSDVPFEKFIIVDNLYQGYLSTQNNDLLVQMSSILYGKQLKLNDAQQIAVFYWVLSLKEFLSKKFNDFFKPQAESDSESLAIQNNSVEDAMNAQIRALTKGDVTKERLVLSLDTWRALTELNAQAREYQELKEKYKTK